MANWSDQQQTTMCRLYLAGEPRAVIAETMGLTEDAIKHRIEATEFTKAEKRARRVAYKALRYLRKKIEIRSPYDYSYKRSNEERPSEAALCERGVRLSVPPRDLTAALCGDPRPGYSALERRT